MYKFQWKISEYRRDRDKPVQKSIKQSDYAKQLMRIGTERNE
ncbi:hypothetical protein [Sediminibacillus albus]|uniref:Uncharacterized protein n=1 Tax=Sediminibacillus albus TaxID=407036 RepID=A0A1G8X6T8_9BACI|nr:hypothetical protein [Sediminibacillus albus]SDJ86107.1 hypothetical protein SAMN05216243_1187 [Sediminibacillus albus]